MDAEQLAAWLERRLTEIPGLHLSPRTTRVKHILNWGGFVNHSFTVGDGSVQYHLKITNDVDSIARLQRWLTVHDLLEKRYRAPELIQWIEFSEIGFAGLLFQHLSGGTSSFSGNFALVEQVVELTNRLHKDEDIRSYLQDSRPGKTYLDHFAETYIDRFTADLEAVAASRLSFVSPALFTWMQRETDLLRETASRARSFHHPAVEAVHGDLNEGNVLVTANGWFVVDWDDLTIGDPAVDFAVLLWPMVREGAGWRDFLRSEPEDGFAERLEVCLRAQLLDEVIDSLADYVEARAVPASQAAVQLVKRKLHKDALDKYRTIWPAKSFSALRTE